jgi:small redox-active disulfide protein 2
MTIKVLGPWNPWRDAAVRNVKEALAASGLDARVEEVNDILTIARYGVFNTPAVVVNGVVKCAGRVPPIEEILTWLRQ